MLVQEVKELLVTAAELWSNCLGNEAGSLVASCGSAVDDELCQEDLLSDSNQANQLPFRDFRRPTH
jgi:hypothetical protein